MRTATTLPSPPGPHPIPLLGWRGNLIRFMRDPLAYMTHLHRTYGDVVALARGATEYVFVFSPEYNQQVLSDTTLFLNLGPESSPLRMPAGSALSRLFAGLTQMNGAKHRAHRSVIASAFHRRNLETWYHDIVAVTGSQLARWTMGESRNIFEEMRELTLAIAVKTFVGLELGAGGRAMCRLLDQWTKLVFSLPTIAFPFDIPASTYRRLLITSEELERVVRGLIEQKRRQGAAGHDVLSRLVQTHDANGAGLDDDELIGQTNFLFMAGHATTASALTWTLFLLAQHPEVTCDVLDELDAASVQQSPRWEHLEHMPLLTAVVKESLRLIPPVLWWSRVSAAPVTLGPFQLGSGTRVVHSAFITHRIESRFPEPNRFIPARWLTAAPGGFEYLPFSAGPRMCVGSTFATTELKIVLAMILQRCRLTIPPGATIDLRGPMLAEPKHGLVMRITPRDYRADRAVVRGSIRQVVDLTNWDRRTASAAT